MAEFREIADAQEALRTYFGCEALRPGQAEVVQAILAGRDAMGIMPTGGGMVDIISLDSRSTTIVEPLLM